MTSMGSTTSTWPYLDVSEYSMLVDAPLGPYPMLEAAFAWHEARPRDWCRRGRGAAHADPRIERFTTIIETNSRAAASRLVFILSALTWTVANEPMYGIGPTRVDLPASAYHRVLRVLRAGSLAGRRMLGASATSQAPAAVALGVWRMAVLLMGRFDATANSLPIQVKTQAALGMLVGAGDVLGLSYSVHRARGVASVVSADRRQVLRRLTQVALPG
jgi:hypothetical protein